MSGTARGPACWGADASHPLETRPSRPAPRDLPLKTSSGWTDTPVVTLPLTPELAPWVVPSSLGVLALLLSTYLVLSVRRRRLAEGADLEDVADLLGDIEQALAAST